MRRCNKKKKKTRDSGKYTAPHPHPKLTALLPDSSDKCPPQTNSRVPEFPKTLGFCFQGEEGRIHVLVFWLHIHSSKCPWSSLCYLGESQPPPSSDAISRTAAQNHTQTQQHPHLCMQTHTITEAGQGGCPPCFCLFFSTILLEKTHLGQSQWVTPICRCQREARKGDQDFPKEQDTCCVNLMT